MFRHLMILPLLLAALPASASGVVDYGLTADSPTLGRPIPYAVYRPISAEANRRFPVVYLLHGKGGAEGEWFSWGRLGEMLDTAIAEGRLPPMIVVAPGFGNSWYVDSDVGKFETALATDLVAAIDASLPTAACREGRAIGGLSMGGYGAMLQVIDHPDEYVAGISLSGALHEPFVANDPRLQWVPEVYDDVFGTPFDPQLFNRKSPFMHVEWVRRLDARQKPAIYLTIGDKDYPDLIEGNANLHNRLIYAGVDSTLRITAGDHSWDTWRAQIIPALEWLAPKLSANCR
jgi:S-formylglutathione hydrolase FrmB